MGSAAECQGAMYSGNLGRIAVELVKTILNNAGFPHLYLQTEAKSKVCGFGSMVTYVFGNDRTPYVWREHLTFLHSLLTHTTPK